MIKITMIITRILVLSEPMKFILNVIPLVRKWWRTHEKKNKIVDLGEN